MTGSALAFPTPASLGSLDHYIQAVNRFPLLTAEQETELGRRWRNGEDVDAARQLVMSHLRLVVAVSRNYQGYGLPQGDLIQEGNVGLMKAVRRFDPERGVRLVSFALHWIKAEIHEYILRNWRLVKVATTKAQRKLFFNLRSMKTSSHALSRDQAAAIARELGVKREEVVEMQTRLAGHDIALDPKAKELFREFQEAGFGNYPVCMAKTQYSFSTDPNAKGAPTGHVLNVRDVRLSAGAEFIVVVCGDIMTMPGLPKVPSANSIKLNAQGQIEGLF